MVNSTLYNSVFGIQNGGRGGKEVAKNVSSLFYEKRELLVKTFANLIFQLGITYYAMEKFSKEEKDGEKDGEKDKYNNGITILVFIYMFAFVIILGLIPMPTWLKFILFCIFSYGGGFIFSGLKRVAGEEVIHTALIGAMSIFAIMFSIGVFVLLSGIRLGFRTGLLLFYGLLFLIIAQLVNNFTAQTSAVSKGLTIFGLILFSFYIIYDTNQILQKNYYGDFITASLDYYLDIINIFTKLVSLNSDN
jgi:FtsH-binding integral membrane protein